MELLGEKRKTMNRNNPTKRPISQYFQLFLLKNSMHALVFSITCHLDAWAKVQNLPLLEVTSNIEPIQTLVEIIPPLNV